MSTGFLTDPGSLVHAIFAVAQVSAVTAQPAAPASTKVLLAQLDDRVPPSQQTYPALRVSRAKKLRLSCYEGFSISPTRGAFNYLHGSKVTSSASCNFEPIDGLTMGGSINLYPVAGQQRPWDPDFTFRASYRINPKLSIEYGDYNGNRLNHLTAGTLFDGTAWLVYRLPVKSSKRSTRSLLATLDCSAGAGMPLQPNQGEASLKASLSCGISPVKKFNLRMTALAYPLGNQQPWDPDFTYTIGYQITPRLAVGYANYSGNRWFWRQSQSGGGRSGGGSVYLSVQVR